MSKLKVYERLEAFKRANRLTDEQVSAALGTPLGTYRTWKYRKATPPASVAQLLTLLEQRSQVRTWLGVTKARGRKRPRGHGFQPGNIWRFGSKTREAALRERQSGNR